MKRIGSWLGFTTLAAIGLTACQPEPPFDRAAEERVLRAIMARVNEAWETENLESFGELVAHDADMLNFGADINEHWTGWDALVVGLKRQFESFDETKVTPHELVVELSPSGDAAWLAQTMNMRSMMLGSLVSLEARITAVFAKRNGEWKMVQFHYSLPISESVRLGS
jgi:hypothetical protein